MSLSPVVEPTSKFPQTQIGSYELGILIQSKERQFLYEALNSETNEKVAIKLFPVWGSLQSLRYSREAKFLNHVKGHPNIVGFKPIQKMDDSYDFIVFDWGGKSLKSLIEENNIPFESNRIVYLIKQILLGLSHIHEKKVIHRDLKPSNILADEEDRIVIADFGAAQFVDEEKEKSKGDLKAILYLRSGGPAPFMAPEQMRMELNFYSDVYSVGMTLWQLLFNDLPVKSKKNRVTSYVEKTEKLPQNLSLVENELDRGKSPAEIFSYAAELFEMEECIRTAATEQDVSLLKLALEMLNVVPDKRPTCHELLEKLNKVM